MAAHTAKCVAGSLGSWAVFGDFSMSSMLGMFFHVRMKPMNSAAKASPAAPAIISWSVHPALIHLPTDSTVLGVGELVRSRVGLKADSKSGRNSMKAMRTGGMSPSVNAHSFQSATLGVSSMIVSKRDLTGSRIPETPAM